MNPKPIEGHLEALGFKASYLTDENRHQIAMVIIDAYVYGNGYLQRGGPGKPDLWRKDPKSIQIVVD